MKHRTMLSVGFVLVFISAIGLASIYAYYNIKEAKKSENLRSEMLLQKKLAKFYDNKVTDIQNTPCCSEWMKCEMDQ